MSNIKLIGFSLAEQLDQLNRSANADSPYEKLMILTGQDKVVGWTAEQIAQMDELMEQFNVGGRNYTLGQLDHSYEAPESVEEEYE